ncbi:MAG TPA: hypothetical protein VHI52_04095 [Verrucomicrobiae bacterium]|nr:hypothetical protein [Verrucomicrobiae bacterium]
MNQTQARKTVLLMYLLVMGVFTFGGLWGGGLPNPKRYIGATVAYLALSVGAEFAAPVAGAFAILYGFYILIHSLPQVKGLSANNQNFGNVQPSDQSQAQTLPGLQGQTLVKAQ